VATPSGSSWQLALSRALPPSPGKSLPVSEGCLPEQALPTLFLPVSLLKDGPVAAEKSETSLANVPCIQTRARCSGLCLRESCFDG
jgi:hypothetical protein